MNHRGVHGIFRVDHGSLTDNLSRRTKGGQSQGDEENYSADTEAGWEKPALLNDHKGCRRATAGSREFFMRVSAGQVAVAGLWTSDGSFRASTMVSASDENAAASSRTVQDEKKQEKYGGA